MVPTILHTKASLEAIEAAKADLEKSEPTKAIAKTLLQEKFNATRPLDDGTADTHPKP
jgi:hypothetical protein